MITFDVRYNKASDQIEFHSSDLQHEPRPQIGIDRRKLGGFMTITIGDQKFRATTQTVDSGAVGISRVGLINLIGTDGNWLRIEYAGFIPSIKYRATDSGGRNWIFRKSVLTSKASLTSPDGKRVAMIEASKLFSANKKLVLFEKPDNPTMLAFFLFGSLVAYS
jgi:hypothetical protein